MIPISFRRRHRCRLPLKAMTLPWIAAAALLAAAYVIFLWRAASNAPTITEPRGRHRQQSPFGPVRKGVVVVRPIDPSRMDHDPPTEATEGLRDIVDWDSLDRQP